MEALQIDELGRWSYPFVISWYYLLLASLTWRFRAIFLFARWWAFFLVTVVLFIALGIVLEWISGVFFVWTFPPGRDLFHIHIPVLGWLTGHQIPLCEFLWIVGVVPLFYFMYLWATLFFYDVIYLLDEYGNYVGREERWVGFHLKGKILMRSIHKNGHQYEIPLTMRSALMLFIVRRRRKIHDQKTYETYLAAKTS